MNTHELIVRILALRPGDATRALGIGEQLLWSTPKAPEIPDLRIGRAVTNPVDSLRDYLADQARRSRR